MVKVAVDMVPDLRFAIRKPMSTTFSLRNPADYKKATIRGFDAGPTSSFVDLPVAERPERTLLTRRPARVGNALARRKRRGAVEKRPEV